ncbi:up-regulator of cell proliferation-like isoform X2 [Genypterus blacodes]
MSADESEDSKDVPLHFKQEKHAVYGVPRYWGGHVSTPGEPPKLKAECFQPPVHRAPDDPISHHQIYRVRAESKHSDETSDYSSTLTSGSRDSQNDEDTVIQDYVQSDVTCDICLHTRAVKTCLTCNVSYCEYDVRQHYTVEALMRHTLSDVCGEVERKRCHHIQNSLDHFCRTDQMQICRTCVVRKHRGHDIVLQKTQHEAEQVVGVEEDPDLHAIVVPPPGEITFVSVKPDSVVLSWGCPEGLEGPKTFRVKWRPSKKAEDYIPIKDFYRIEINNLKLGQKYSFSVATEDGDGNLSDWTTASIFTVVPAPRNLTKEYSGTTTLSLKWTKGDKLEQIPHGFLLTIRSQGKETLAIYTEDCNKMFSDLKPHTEYNISVSSLLSNQRQSEPVSVTIHTDPCLREVLSKIGLEDQYEIKLTRSMIIEINCNDSSENTLETMQSLPGAFLRRLMLGNPEARSVKCVSCDGKENSNAINPLDLITAVFLCSDGLLQQEIVLKMSLCHFAIPLLVPNHETREITMMLWSMYDIVRRFAPSIQAFVKSSCEERIVLCDFPLVSFVRLGTTCVSKSHILNKMLSNSQSYHDTFYHRKMVSGDVPRRISDGLVEMSWFLPCGIKAIDSFTDPIAVANLRGDIKVFDQQFAFLCQESAAVYIFCDDSEADCFKIIEGRDVSADVVMISSSQGKNFTLKRMTTKPHLKTTDISQKKRTDMELTKALQESLSKMLENSLKKKSVEKLAEKARGCGILVDGDSDECQSAMRNMHKITRNIDNPSKFKDEQLPSQGNVWKALSWLQNESCRLRKAGNRNIENYQESLKTKEKELRRKQQRFEMTAAMSAFLHGLVTSEVQRYFFLKWLEIDLDNLCRQLSRGLQDEYKHICLKTPQPKDLIAEMEEKMSANSLQLDHFFRECGQLYEYACYLPEFSRQRKNMEHLPALCAQMLSDGFSVELVDGDASNIPMKWINDVLTELHYIMHSNSKVKVISIIGAENTGKSTLLNTMFGARFAVSRGRSSRGAFIQLININKDIREELGCDCIMIIDAEGLKPHQMVQEDDCHELHIDVAKLAVGLSDIVIVSLSTDTSREKDILEIAVPAFTRLQGAEQKPLCHFVHTNISEVPSLERERAEELVEHLNELTLTDCGLKKDNVTKISDVMKFDPHTCCWCIPNLWSGTPPMTAISIEYSETVHALKKRLINDLKKCQGRGELTHFATRIENLWKAL